MSGLPINSDGLTIHGHRNLQRSLNEILFVTGNWWNHSTKVGRGIITLIRKKNIDKYVHNIICINIFAMWNIYIWVYLPNKYTSYTFYLCLKCEVRFLVWFNWARFYSDETRLSDCQTDVWPWQKSENWLIICLAQKNNWIWFVSAGWMSGTAGRAKQQVFVWLKTSGPDKRNWRTSVCLAKTSGPNKRNWRTSVCLAKNVWARQMELKNWRLVH